MKRTKLLVISHSGITDHHIEKYKILSERYQYEILLIVPQKGREEGVVRETKSKIINQNFHIRKRFFFFPLKIYLFFSIIIWKDIWVFKPDLIYLEEEPMSFFAIYFSVIKNIFLIQAPLIFFTWENIEHGWLKSFPKYFFYNFFQMIALKLCSGVIAGNQAALGLTRKKGVRKLARIPQYGVDPRWLKYSSFSLEEEFVIGYIGRLIPEKGIFELLSSLKKIEIPYRLIIIGEGRCKPEIQEYVLENRINAELSGHIEHSRIPEITRQFHCLIIPSKTTSYWKEQFGRVIIEAMAVGVIVIGSDSGAIPEVVGEYGIIYPENDISLLRLKILDLYHRYADYQQKFQGMKQYVQKNFTNETIAKKTGQFFFQFKDSFFS